MKKFPMSVGQLTNEPAPKFSMKWLYKEPIAGQIPGAFKQGGTFGNSTIPKSSWMRSTEVDALFRLRGQKLSGMAHAARTTCRLQLVNITLELS